MQNISEFIADREIISDNDMDISSDDYMEDDEQEEMEIEHFNLSEEFEKLFDLIIKEGFTTKAAALATGINVRTAQNYVKTYNNDPERRLPGSYSKPRGRPRDKLTEEHSKFLVDYIEKNTTAILDELKLKFLHKHNITLKKLEKIPAARNSDRAIALRKAIVEQYKSDADMDFSKNCVFIDEAVFNLHTQRSHGRSLKGTPAKSTVPTGKGVTFTILGALSQADIINIGVKKPESASSEKERQMVKK
ncbi:hypothetical protein G6F57_002252 [Rhizopus arrhizus]|nr:hypothetical protein G6F30_004671 [Rhizopus arrhizus]KAG1401179.1 hypothetical protein G6F58_010785 [Rhizopus delemar]KAG0982498.1 hypothetical protein G6F29_006257 [Rhizopus arrhizus]KAG0994070.1 hypothetical protein G6F28_006082 [Rhizopus arrhizus]KAG1001716.1 hypothetical protein G6F27_012615 [Rhizopus arrhizus]